MTCDWYSNSNRAGRRRRAAALTRWPGGRALAAASSRRRRSTYSPGLAARQPLEAALGEARARGCLAAKAGSRAKIRSAAADGFKSGVPSVAAIVEARGVAQAALDDQPMQLSTRSGRAAARTAPAADTRAAFTSSDLLAGTTEASDPHVHESSSPADAGVLEEPLRRQPTTLGAALQTAGDLRGLPARRRRRGCIFARTTTLCGSVRRRGAPTRHAPRHSARSRIHSTGHHHQIRRLRRGPSTITDELHT